MYEEDEILGALEDELAGSPSDFKIINSTEDDEEDTLVGADEDLITEEDEGLMIGEEDEEKIEE